MVRHTFLNSSFGSPEMAVISTESFEALCCAGILWSQTIVTTRLVSSISTGFGGISDCRRPLPNGQD